ncbi:MAG: PQQ-binding-like beta-propeller repeat protein [Planctomycetota bacterium]
MTTGSEAVAVRLDAPTVMTVPLQPLALQERIRISHRCLPLWFLVAILGLCPAAASADVGSALIPLLVGADGVIQEYRDALERIEEGDSLDGIRRLQILHEGIWGENPLMLGSATDLWRVARPLSDQIIDRLQSLSPELQDAYRKEYDSRARSVLERAILDMSPSSLLRTAALYPLTAVREEALVFAGDFFFEQNQSELALQAWDDALVGFNTELDEDLYRALLLRRGIALQSLGKLVSLKALAKEASKILKGGFEPFSEHFRNLINTTELENDFAAPSLPVKTGLIAWKTHDYSTHVASSTSRGRGYYSEGTGEILSPSFGADWVGIATSRKLLRYDLRTGKLISDISLRPGAPYFEEQDVATRLWSVSDNDVLLSSYVARASRREDYLGFDIQVSLPWRGIKCWDLAGTGRLRWDTGARDLADDMLRTTSFNSAPVVQGDRVWALGWRKSGYIDVSLWCLDANTGEQIWSRPIVGNQVELTMFGEPAREPILGSILVRDGVVYCCSNLGAVAALRAWDGEVLWVLEYDRESQRTYRGRYRPQRRSSVWAPNPLVLKDGTLFVTPLDSDQLYAINAKNGNVTAQLSGKGLGPYMLGTTEGRLVLFGDLLTTMLASDIGREGFWKQSLSRSPGLGRPALVKDGVVYVSAGESALFHQGFDPVSAPRLLATLAESRAGDTGRGIFRIEEPLAGRVDVHGDRIIITNLNRATCLTQKRVVVEEKR